MSLHELPDKTFCGFGDNTIKLTDGGDFVCFLGKLNGEEMVFFPKAVSPAQIEAVADFLQKKKMRKYIDNDQFERAQTYADRKFKG